ncbi:MAG: glycosyltransferase [Gammaproteobacteria bacterium]|nr:glycosyltransferase [Gammaproteobacteria bacterium]
MSQNKRKLTILGVHLYSSAYPNTRFSVDLLRNSGRLETREIVLPMYSAAPFSGQKPGLCPKSIKFLRLAVRAVIAHSYVILRYCVTKKPDICYITYPGTGLLILMSLLPRFMRPRMLIADGFISIYDTAVCDRKLLMAGGLPARLLFLLEKHAFGTATRITVDTEENRQYYTGLFRIDVDRFRAIPLATDETSFVYNRYSPGNRKCKVLFIGTFVPLQGTDVIAKAIALLGRRPDIEFVVIGTGQAVDTFQQIIRENENNRVTWISEWQDSDSLATHIQSADICLGIFADSPKTRRVWPLKNYAYMACGRAIITADTECARRMFDGETDKPVITVPAGDAQALAGKIEHLADSPELRTQLSERARNYYDTNLSNQILRDKLINELMLS